MKIAITGGSGFIGRYIVDRLSDHNQIVILTRNPEKVKSNSNNTNIKHLYTDYTYDSLINCFKGCDSIIHLAANRFTNDKVLYIDNIKMDFNVFDAAYNLSIKNIVYSSSRSVYDNNAFMTDELSNIMPINLYGLAKLQSEFAVNFFNEKGLAIKVLRLAQVLGLGEKDNKVTTIMLKKAFNKETILLTAKGIIKREYIYVKDLADAIFIAIQNFEAKGVFNLGSEETVSFEDMAHIISFVFNNNTDYCYTDSPVELNEKSCMNSLSFRQTFDWQPTYSFKTAVSDIYKSLQNRKIAEQYGFYNN